MKMVDVKYGLWLKVMRYASCMEGDIVYGTGSPIVTSQTDIIVKKKKLHSFASHALLIWLKTVK